MDHVSKYQIVITKKGMWMYLVLETGETEVKKIKQAVDLWHRQVWDPALQQLCVCILQHPQETNHSVLLHSAESTLHWRPAWWRNKQNTYTHADKHNKTDQLDITSSSLFGTDIYRGRPYTPICIINTYTHMILISSATHKPLIFTNEQETLLYTFRAVHNNFSSSGGEQHHLLNRMDRSEYEGLL